MLIQDEKYNGGGMFHFCLIFSEKMLVFRLIRVKYYNLIKC